MSEPPISEEPTYRHQPPRQGPKKWRHSPYFWAVIAGAIAIPALRPFLRHVPDPPPVLAELPSFQLTDQGGEPFGSAELQGNVYIANTFFTSCQTVCPPLMEAVSQLQGRLEQEESVRREPLAIRLVSISVDPHNDTPSRLREYAAEYGADFDRWTLLTGSEADVRALVVEGFMTDMGAPQMDPEGQLLHISHANRLMLVDGLGRIRGYYDTDAVGVDEVFHRAQHVLRAREDESEPR